MGRFRVKTFLEQAVGCTRGENPWGQTGRRKLPVLIFEVGGTEGDTPRDAVIDAAAASESRVVVGLGGDEAGVMEAASANQEFDVG